MKTTFIYALSDPITGSVRYIGKSDNPKSRFAGHLKESKREHTRKANWINFLKNQGLFPVLETLDEVPELEWPMWEVAYIQFFREQNFDLVNGNGGGEGGINPTDETRFKISKANKGRVMTDEQVSKLSISLMGRKLTSEHRANISASGMGKKRSEETRAKMRKSKSSEHRAAISKAMKGKVFSQETRERMSVSAKIRSAAGPRGNDGRYVLCPT